MNKDLATPTLVTPEMAASFLEQNANNLNRMTKEQKEKNVVRNTDNHTFKEVPISSIRTAAPFKDFMPFDASTVSVIADSMCESGYDMAYPIVVWKDHDGVIIDGHLRFAAAQKAGLKNVIIAEKFFAGESEALEYAFHKNMLRSSYTDAELLEIYEKAMMSVISGVKKRLLKNARKTAEVR